MKNYLHFILSISLFLILLSCDKTDNEEFDSIYFGNLNINSIDELMDPSFQAIEVLEGNLLLFEIQGLTDLSQLNSLKQIKGRLGIFRNPDLESLNGIQNLTEAQEISISSNPTLLSLEGLENIQIVNVLYINDNARLNSLSGLNGLTEVLESIQITENTELLSLDGLHSLRSTTIFHIVDNPKLLDLKALSNLSSSNEIFIWNNNRLQTLDGLDGLIETQNVFIGSNNCLYDFCALSNILLSDSTIQFGASTNMFNPSLSDFENNNCSSL